MNVLNELHDFTTDLSTNFAALGSCRMFTFICKASEISEGELYRFDLKDKPLLVTAFEGTYFVSDSICTHEEADLSLGMFSNGTLTCPLHSAKFEIRSGKVLSGPDGSAPDSISNLRLYPAKIENGEVWADI
ncbi:MAG: non-heme iron oxygenase ferredoxin subunit [Thaumarchaeota archaeon]|nr:non-heme iron oxygenase ferredoxin subunit [Nitrososphaerota archaeon]